MQAGDVCVICTTVSLGSARISEEDPGLEPRDDVVMHKGVKWFNICSKWGNEHNNTHQLIIGILVYRLVVVLT